MANTITFFRIAASIVLLFCPVFSPAFYAFYIAAGLSDMLDGFVARKTDSVSKLGARLDTMADFVFVVVCLIKLLPVLRHARERGLFPFNQKNLWIYEIAYPVKPVWVLRNILEARLGLKFPR